MHWRKRAPRKQLHLRRHDGSRLHAGHGLWRLGGEVLFRRPRSTHVLSGRFVRDNRTATDSFEHAGEVSGNSGFPRTRASDCWRRSRALFEPRKSRRGFSNFARNKCTEIADQPIGFRTREKKLTRVSYQEFRMLKPHNLMLEVCCGAGVPPAIFLTPHRAKTPAGRRRHERPAFLHESEELHFAARIRREKCGLSAGQDRDCTRLIFSGHLLSNHFLASS